MATIVEGMAPTVMVIVCGDSLEQPVVWGTEGFACVSTVKEEEEGACMCEEDRVGRGGGFVVPDQPEHELVQEVRHLHQIREREVVTLFIQLLVV